MLHRKEVADIMMMRGLFDFFFWTFSGSVSAIHHPGWTGSSALGSASKRRHKKNEYSFVLCLGLIVEY